MSKELNNRVTLYRKMAGLTQTEVAEKMNMKYSTYSQMERTGNITADRLIMLAEIFNIPPETLLYEKTPQNEATMPTLNQTSSLERPAPFITTRKEENIIKILRNLPKDSQSEIIDFIDKKYKESKSK